MHPGLTGRVSMAPADTYLTADLGRRLAAKKPIKIEFPSFGKRGENSDPLRYLEKCRDYLALNPLTNEEVLATLRNVLHGTARDWWEVARLSVGTWAEFEASFLSAFLAEDYADELAERVRTRVQAEGESIRDFAYSYRSLCKRWKPAIQEEEIIKLILKNINPRIASQLRKRVSTVEELARLGQQLERDKDNQRLYEQRKQHAQQASKGAPQRPPPPPGPQPPAPNRQPFCWRCKQPHSPALCPHQPSANNQPKKDSTAAASANSSKSNPPRLGTVSSTSHDACPDGSVQPCSYVPGARNVIPRQLMVPISISSWFGMAILDTGSSYTLISEPLWETIKTPNSELHAWLEGPLYLADGQAKQPLGHTELTFTVHDKSWTLPTVILSGQTLVLPAVLGLDFLFFSGMQIDVSHLCFWFPPSEDKHSFLIDSPGRNDWGHTPLMAFFSSLHPDTLNSLHEVKDSDSWHQAVENTMLQGPDKEQLLKQLRLNSDVCTSRLGCTDLLKHKIFLTHQVPLKQRPYKVSPSKLQVIKELVDDMLAKGVIEPSSSPWASPVVLIPKKTGGLRFCVDYRRLNTITHSDAYPLPTIQDILESLSGAAVFTNIDLNSGYWQVQMDPDSQEKTAFVCGLGLYHFKVMPFGLKNAPASFQRLMELALKVLQGKVCFVYLDDIIIYSPDVKQHFYDLQIVFNCLKEAGLTVNMGKSNFFQSRIKFLGHIVSASGIQADPEKTQAIQDFPVPTNLKAVQRFLGMAGWYHRFVPNFSRIAEPLNNLKRKGARFRWTPDCQNAFTTLKDHLVQPPVLGHPDFNLPFTVYTDASNIGLGAILVQQTGLGTEEVLAFASRALNPAERNYTATELECLAVVWALQKWRHYLEGRHFTVVTDHAALTWVFKTSKPSPRLMRWALLLQEFTFSVEYRKGRYNSVPDALSRAPPTCAAIMKVKPNTSKLDLPLPDDEVWKAQQQDVEAQSIYQSILEHGEKQVNEATKLTIIEDKVYRVVQLPYRTLYQVYVPTSLRPQLLQAFHDDPSAGHLGCYKTYKRLQALAFWPKMSIDVKDYVKNCVICQQYKPEGRKPAGKLQQTIVTKPWQMLGVDLMGPLPKSSNLNTNLLVFVDYYSRWVEFFPLRRASAEIAARILVKEIITRWGVPEYLLSDQGSQFVSELFQEVCKAWNLARKFTSTYHPQTNLTERVNRTVKTMVASYVGLEHKHWDRNLHYFRFAINSAVQESTGVSPAEINLGRPLRGPLDGLLQPHILPDSPAYTSAEHLEKLKDIVNQNLNQARERQKRNYDAKRREVTLKDNDRVWLKSHPYSKAEKKFTAKLAPKWQGPYRIVRSMGPLNYEIVMEETGEDLRVVHVSRLKHCYPSAKDLDEIQRRKVLDILQEESDDEEFLGFTDTDLKSSL